MHLVKTFGIEIKPLKAMHELSEIDEMVNKFISENNVKTAKCIIIINMYSILLLMNLIILSLSMNQIFLIATYLSVKKSIIEKNKPERIA